MIVPRLDVIRQAVRTFVRRDVADHDPLISSGLVDSLALLQLIIALEEALGVALPTATLQPDDFENIYVIAETVERMAKT